MPCAKKNAPTQAACGKPTVRYNQPPVLLLDTVYAAAALTRHLLSQGQQSWIIAVLAIPCLQQRPVLQRHECTWGQTSLCCALLQQPGWFIQGLCRTTAGVAAGPAGAVGATGAAGAAVPLNIDLKTCRVVAYSSCYPVSDCYQPGPCCRLFRL